MTAVYRIVQYIQPWEIDDFERQVHSILPSTYYIPTDAKVIWDVTMNVDIVDWANSKMPKEYYTKRFEYLQKIVNYNLTAEFDLDPEIKGCSDKRRVCANKTQDYIIWLDSDVFSSTYILPSLIVTSTSEIIKYDTFILTPEIVKFWDSSWDLITNKNFLSKPYTFRDNFNVYSIDQHSSNEISIRQNTKGIKFAGGWFNLFTNSVFQKIPVPHEIGAYGPDDTYTMHCAQHLGIPQYLLEGVLTTDIPYPHHRYARAEYKKDNLCIQVGDRERISDEELYQLILKFYDKNKLHNTQL